MDRVAWDSQNALAVGAIVFYRDKFSVGHGVSFVVFGMALSGDIRLEAKYY